MEDGVSDRSAWLHGPGALCRLRAEFPERPFRLILLGAPGVGKGTQAEYLCKALSTCQLSTGDVFRAAKCGHHEPSPAMVTALETMQRGDLVNDQMVLQLVAERAGCLRCEFGFLLDGFPRTLHQAKSLDKMLAVFKLPLDGVLSFELDEQEIVQRLSGRRTCRKCHATFHVNSKPPKCKGICDHCGGELYQRGDDNAVSIQTRLEEYHEKTVPLTQHYERLGLLLPVSAAGSPEEVHTAAMDALRTKVAQFRIPLGEIKEDSEEEAAG